MDANSNKDEFYPISVAETELQESVMLQTWWREEKHHHTCKTATQLNFTRNRIKPAVPFCCLKLKVIRRQKRTKKNNSHAHKYNHHQAKFCMKHMQLVVSFTRFTGWGTKHAYKKQCPGKSFSGEEVKHAYKKQCTGYSFSGEEANWSLINAQVCVAER